MSSTETLNYNSLKRLNELKTFEYSLVRIIELYEHRPEFYFMEKPRLEVEELITINLSDESNSLKTKLRHMSNEEIFELYIYMFKSYLKQLKKSYRQNYILIKQI